MCLAVPMKIVEIKDDGSGVADLDGVRHDVNLSLIEHPTLDDFVIVHAGFAIEKLDTVEADTTLAMFRELAAQNARQNEIH